MENQVFLDEMPLDDVIEINETTKHNPVKLALSLNLTPRSLDQVLLANNIRRPFEELTIGKLIAVPALRFTRGEVQQGESNSVEQSKPIKRLKNANVSGTNKVTF